MSFACSNKFIKHSPHGGEVNLLILLGTNSLCCILNTTMKQMCPPKLGLFNKSEHPTLPEFSSKVSEAADVIIPSFIEVYRSIESFLIDLIEKMYLAAFEQY